MRRHCRPPVAGVAADIERLTAIWRECLAGGRGACLFGDRPRMADAMYAPVGARLVACDVTLGPGCAACCRTIITLPLMTEWIADAQAEPEELDVQGGQSADSAAVSGARRLCGCASFVLEDSA
ncbi:MAG: hypothetical protein K8H87_04085 [Pseudorhodoplanes sp.]|nr:hypothetical protein [Pseudorhodoplanes sp.]